VRDLARARRRDAVPGDGGPQQFYKGRVER